MSILELYLSPCKLHDGWSNLKVLGTDQVLLDLSWRQLLYPPCLETVGYIPCWSLVWVVFFIRQEGSVLNGYLTWRRPVVSSFSAWSLSTLYSSISLADRRAISEEHNLQSLRAVLQEIHLSTGEAPSSSAWKNISWWAGGALQRLIFLIDKVKEISSDPSVVNLPIHTVHYYRVQFSILLHSTIQYNKVS